MKCVVILSGGLDSSVLLSSLIHEGHEVRALGIDYGQRHVRELQCASWQANHCGKERPTMRSLRANADDSDLTLVQSRTPRPI